MKKREKTDIEQQYTTALKSVVYVTLFFATFCIAMWGIMLVIRLAMGAPPA